MTLFSRHLSPAGLITAWLAFGLTASQGCTWGELNDLSRETPVRVYEKPDELTSPSFGLNLVVLERTEEARPPTIVVGGQYTTPAATLEIGPRGGVENLRIVRVAKDQVHPNQDRKGNTVEAMVELSPLGDDARVLLGVPEDNYVRWVRIPPADAASPALVGGGMISAGPNAGTVRGFGGALAAGHLDLPSGQQEWAVADDDNIFILMNESSDATMSPRCYLPSPNSAYGSRYRGLAAGRFAEGDTTDTFVAGIPSPDPPLFGAVYLITWSGAPDCSTVLPSPTMGGRTEQFFGTALVAVDLNGDQVDDLIVGSPNKNDMANTSSRVYVYLSTGSPAALDLSTPSYSFEGATLGFGARVGAVDVTGDGVFELVVGDPDGAFGENGGRAILFQVAWTHSPTTQTLTEESDGVVIGDTAEPSKMLGVDLKARSTAFGSSIAGLTWSFGEARQELIIGGAKLIYGFYLTGLEGDDDASSPGQDPRQ